VLLATNSFFARWKSTNARKTTFAGKIRFVFLLGHESVKLWKLGDVRPFLVWTFVWHLLIFRLIYPTPREPFQSGQRRNRQRVFRASAILLVHVQLIGVGALKTDHYPLHNSHLRVIGSFWGVTCLSTFCVKRKDAQSKQYGPVHRQSCVCSDAVGPAVLTRGRNWAEFSARCHKWPRGRANSEKCHPFSFRGWPPGSRKLQRFAGVVIFLSNTCSWFFLAKLLSAYVRTMKFPLANSNFPHLRALLVSNERFVQKQFSKFKCMIAGFKNVFVSTKCCDCCKASEK